MMLSTNAAALFNSDVDTILTLPERTGSFAIASACREAGLAFLNESQGWGKAELAMWLMGPYSQVSQYVSSPTDRRSGEFVRPVPLLREIDARMVERVIRSAREEVLDVLSRLPDAEGAASFAFSMISSGFVARCEDARQVAGWVPTTDARRLADRVLSLFAVDYLTRPADYDTELTVCAVCESVDFDGLSRFRGTCHRHGSGIFAPRARVTMPYLPEGA